MVLSMACYNRDEQSSGVQKILGTYFRDRGMKDRELEMLNRLGVSASVTTLDSVKKDLKAARRRKARRIASSGAAVVAIDSVEPMPRQTVASGIVFEGRHMPIQGIESEFGQIPINPGLILAPPRYTIGSPTSKKIREVLIHWAIEETFPEIYKRKFGKRPSLPEMSRLNPSATDYTPLTAVMKDKSSKGGTLEAIRDIYGNQLKGIPAEHYKERLLVVGSQETAGILRSVAKCLSPLHSYHRPCRDKWAMPVPGLFDLRMHTLEFIWSQHYIGKDGTTGLWDHEMILGNADTRNHVAKDTNVLREDGLESSKMYEMELLCRRSYNARVVAMVFCDFIIKREGGSTSATIEEYFASLGAYQVERLIGRLASDISFDSVSRPPYREEQESHYTFLEHMESYFILKHGIELGDLGLIREAVSRLVCYFSAVSNDRFADEMMYMQLMICGEALRPEGQQAVLSNCLVNLTGREDGWVETDRFARMLNAQRTESSETLTTAASSLAGPMMNLGLGLTRDFGMRTKRLGEYASVCTLAAHLVKNGSAVRHPPTRDGPNLKRSLYVAGLNNARKRYGHCLEVFVNNVLIREELESEAESEERNGDEYNGVLNSKRNGEELFQLGKEVEVENGENGLETDDGLCDSEESDSDSDGVDVDCGFDSNDEYDGFGDYRDTTEVFMDD